MISHSHASRSTRTSVHSTASTNSECKAKIRVVWTSVEVKMEIADMHTAQSHCVDNRKFLSHQQRNAVVVALKSAPLLTPTEVRRNIKNFSPSKQIKADKLGSVRRVVRQIRADMTAVEFPLCPVPVTESYGSLTALCESLFLPTLLLRHNDVNDDFHLGLHTTVCIAFKTDGGESET